MALPVWSRPRRLASRATGAALVLLAAAGTVAHGPAGGLAIAGLLAVLTGILAAAAGGVRWAGIRSRRAAAAVVAAGIVAFAAGAVVESRTASAPEAAPISASHAR